MLADDMACNPRNIFPGEIYHNKKRQVNLYGSSVEVDYRGFVVFNAFFSFYFITMSLFFDFLTYLSYDVTVENFIRVLTGRHHPSVPASRRLLSDSRSNILIYLS